MKNMVRYEICEKGVVREVAASVEDYGKWVKAILEKDKKPADRVYE